MQIPPFSYSFLVQHPVVIFHAGIRRTVWSDFPIANFQLLVKEASAKWLVEIRDAADHVTLTLKIAQYRISVIEC